MTPTQFTGWVWQITGAVRDAKGRLVAYSLTDGSPRWTTR